MLSFGIIAKNFEVFENYIFDCKVLWMVGEGTLSPFHMHLRKRHLLHNLHTMQKDLHRRNREKIGGPLSRTPTRCRKKRHRCLKTSCTPFQSS